MHRDMLSQRRNFDKVFGLGILYHSFRKPAANRCTADLRSALLDQAEPGDTLFARALRSHFEPG
jgi:hypothetical protein